MYKSKRASCLPVKHNYENAIVLIFDKLCVLLYGSLYFMIFQHMSCAIHVYVAKDH